jgi:hypothetical protein
VVAVAVLDQAVLPRQVTLIQVVAMAAQVLLLIFREL